VRGLCGSLFLCEDLCKTHYDSFVMAQLVEGCRFLLGASAAGAALLLQLRLLGMDGEPVVFFGDLEQPLARIPIRERFRFGAGF
jgi:hypothetical protein